MKRQQPEPVTTVTDETIAIPKGEVSYWILADDDEIEKIAAGPGASSDHGIGLQHAVLEARGRAAVGGVSASEQGRMTRLEQIQERVEQDTKDLPALLVGDLANVLQCRADRTFLLLRVGELETEIAQLKNVEEDWIRIAAKNAEDANYRIHLLETEIAQLRQQRGGEAQ